MPANNSREEAINHHRACRGKAHASGIAKQNGQRGKQSCEPRSSISSSSSTSVGRQARTSRKDVTTSTPRPRGDPGGRGKLSRNSTSSWDYSDSDSINSSEAGNQHEPIGDSASSMITRIDMVLDGIERDKGMYDRSVGNADSPKRNTPLRSSRSFRSSTNRSEIFRDNGRRSAKKESWAESLRGGEKIPDDRRMRMERGWDDSSVIRNPRERKWMRITAEIEQRASPDVDDNESRASLEREHGRNNGERKTRSSSSSLSGRVIKRSRCGPGQQRRPVYDVVEWELLLEMAMNRKLNGHGRKKADGGNGEELMKNLDALLENRAPQNFKVFRTGFADRRIRLDLKKRADRGLVTSRRTNCRGHILWWRARGFWRSHIGHLRVGVRFFIFHFFNRVDDEKNTT